MKPSSAKTGAPVTLPLKLTVPVPLTLKVVETQPGSDGDVAVILDMGIDTVGTAIIAVGRNRDAAGVGEFLSGIANLVDTIVVDR